MNLEHHPDVARFLTALSDPAVQQLRCPFCGKTVSIHDHQGENRVSAVCPNCDFHAAVPRQFPQM